MLHSICQQIWKTQQWPQDWKSSVFIPSPKKDNAKECSNYRKIALISHTSKCSKFPKSGFNSMWIMNFQMFKLYLEELDEPKIKLPTSIGSSKKQSSRKTSTSALLTILKSLTVWITTNHGKFLKNLGIPGHLTCLLRNLYAGQEVTELDMEQQTGSKLGKEYVKALIVTLLL